MMKLNQTLAIWGVAAALCLSTGSLLAQNDNGGGGGGQGGFGRGNFDPAQIQQRMMDGIRDQLGFTNDTDWNAVQPLIQKVMDARRDVGFGGGMGRMFRNRGGNGDNANGGGSGAAVSLAASPARRPRPCKRRLMTTRRRRKSRTRWRNTKPRRRPNRPSWPQAQEDLRKVLTVKQEAQATLLGLLQ